MAASVYDRGRRFLNNCTRDYDPDDPYRLPQARLLQVLGVSPKASVALVNEAEGNIFNLSGRDPRELADLDGVGAATAAKILALFALCSQFDQWAND